MAIQSVQGHIAAAAAAAAIQPPIRTPRSPSSLNSHPNQSVTNMAKTMDNPATTFIDYATAIGRLVIAGHSVRWDRSTQTIRTVEDDHAIVYAYRDGATYKIKAETIQDYIYDNERNRSRALIS